MSEVGRGRAPAMIPILRYRDARAALRWLAEAFGFRETLVVAGPGDRVVHAQMRFGDGVIMLGTVREEETALKSPRDVGAATQAIYVHVDAVDEHFERARRAGAEIVRPVADTDHGSREYAARDPEGHFWCFGTYGPDMEQEPSSTAS